MNELNTDRQATEFTCEDGTVLVAKDIETSATDAPSTDCAGCAGEHNAALCFALPACKHFVRDDERDIIFVFKQAC